MTDGEFEKELKWREFELKLREHYSKQSLDFQKMSSEFAKLVIGNLHLMNAGGLIALPSIAGLIGTNNLSSTDRWKAVAFSAGFCVAGLLAAALAAYATYGNYQVHDERAMERQARGLKLAQAALRPQVTKIQEVENEAEDEDEDEDGEGRDSDRSVRMVDFTFRTAQAAGWASLLFFVFACLSFACFTHSR
jgi:hypothetical protein